MNNIKEAAAAVDELNRRMIAVMDQMKANLGKKEDVNMLQEKRNIIRTQLSAFSTEFIIERLLFHFD